MVQPDPAGTLPASSRLTQGIAVLALLLLGLRFRLPEGLTLDVLVGLALAPIWFASVRRYAGGRLLFMLGALSLLCGWWLTSLSSADHDLSTSQLFRNSVLLVGALVGLGVILWAREVLPFPKVVVILGVGAVLGITPENEMFASNPWKFGAGLAISVLLLAIAHATGRRWLELLVVLGLAGVSAMNDARSAFAMLVLTGILIAWQLRPARPTRRGSAFRMVLAIGAAGLFVYSVVQALILDGLLGEAAAERSQDQVETSGSVLVGGRPELAATLALVPHRVLGFGAGTLPSLEDIRVAKEGMSGIGYDPDNGYVERYLFGGQFELHSVAGDLWARYGWVGVAFGAAILVIALRCTAAAITRNSASALVVYLTVRAAWDFAFSPLLTSVLMLTVLAGLVLSPRSDPRGAAEPGRVRR
jgi:hypothetical protein